MSLSECRLMNFGRVRDPRGELVYAEVNNELPFEVKRFYPL